VREFLEDYRQLTGGAPIGRGVVTRVWGSAPRPEGAVLLATSDGRMAGSVSGGCVENAVIEEIQAALARGTPKLLTYGVSHERAWELGLACGGTISVFVEPSVRAELLNAATRREGSVVATVVKGPEAMTGRSLVLLEDGTTLPHQLPAAVSGPIEHAAATALAQLTSRTETITTDTGPIEVLLEVFPRQPTLLVFGGVHVAMPLVSLAKPLGYRVVVADGRPAFLTRERFPEADELIVGWPEEAFRTVGIDRATCIVILSHDPKFDEPALDIALRSPACYVGAIGSRKTQTARRDRLASLGYSPEEIARLHGPIGLDLGGRQPAEIALAILAEITAVRYGRPAPQRS
jgi:xanthine dehydrogenase accessory factor